MFEATQRKMEHMSGLTLDPKQIKPKKITGHIREILILIQEKWEPKQTRQDTSFNSLKRLAS